jgi:hypothetical protein
VISLRLPQVQKSEYRKWLFIHGLTLCLMGSAVFCCEPSSFLARREGEGPSVQFLAKLWKGDAGGHFRNSRIMSRIGGRGRWDAKRPVSRRFAVNQARLLMGVLACNLLHVLRQWYLLGEDGKKSMEWLTNSLIKVGRKSLITVRRGRFVWLQPLPLTRYYQAVFA